MRMVLLDSFHCFVCTGGVHNDDFDMQVALMLGDAVQTVV